MNGHATRAGGQYVNGDFFPVLEVRPLYGRMIAPSDDIPGATPAVVLEFNYWQKQFNGDPKVVGSTVLFNSVPFVIVGITPPEFYGIAPGGHTNMWLPLHAKDVLSKPDSNSARNYEARRIWLYLIGRLKPGVNVERARTETEVLYRGALANAATAAAASPTKGEQEGPKKALDTDLTISLTSAERGLATLRNNFSTQLYILMGVTGLVLLIACANIANLLLSRASARRKEIGIRLAIGASRGRLVRQLLTESLLLAVLGGFTGTLFSYWASRGIVLIVFRHATAPFLAQFHPNFLVLGFAAGIATVAAILFGVVPALTTTRISPGATLKAAGGASGGNRAEGGNRLGGALVTVEMAVALMLVVGAGLFLRTLIQLETLDPGFRTDHILTFSVSPSTAKITDDKTPALGQEIQRRLAGLPGVTGVTWSSDLFVVGDLWTTGLKIQEHPELGDMSSQAMNVGPQFFETLKVPLLAGRSIALTDCHKDSSVVWVNHTFVSRYLKNTNPLGIHIVQDKKAIEIVGVVGDTKFQSLRSDFGPGIFLPMAGGDFTFQLRTAVNPESIEGPARKIVSDVAPNLPVPEMQALQSGIDDDLSAENSLARLSTGFGLLALVLAAIGIYGVLAYSVARRTSEIAIRMSLGAMPGNIMRLVLTEGLRPAAVGAVLGLIGSWGLTRVVAEFLYGVKPLDPITFSGATLVLLLIAALACFIPARRAMRVAPMTSLRYE